MRDNYFIHLFETPLGKYFYDVNKNEIVEVDEDVYEYLSEKSIGSKATEQKVKQLLEKGYLKKKRVKTCRNSSTDYIQDFMDNRISYLVLQVTQMCNLRCEYCVYSGSYETRTHDNKRMDLSTAQKAIDFLISHSFDEDSIELGFYGGEPLLEFALIKDCVKYIKERHMEKNATSTLQQMRLCLIKRLRSFLLIMILLLQSVWMDQRKFITVAGDFQNQMKEVLMLL